MNGLSLALEKNGFRIVPTLLGADECAELVADMEPQTGRPGLRTLLQVAAVNRLANRLLSMPQLAGAFKPNDVPIQCNYFVKDLETNWLVSPHQDISVPVAERIDVTGYSGWTLKDGVHFVQPPEHILSCLVIVRIQLDECLPNAGPLLVYPGSHCAGRLPTAEILLATKRIAPASCLVPKGGALVLRPLLIHASQKSSTTAPRRILHFVFGPPFLPNGLRWACPSLAHENLRGQSKRV